MQIDFGPHGQRALLPDKLKHSDAYFAVGKPDWAKKLAGGGNHRMPDRFNRGMHGTSTATTESNFHFRKNFQKYYLKTIKIASISTILIFSIILNLIKHFIDFDFKITSKF